MKIQPTMANQVRSRDLKGRNRLYEAVGLVTRSSDGFDHGTLRTFGRREAAVLISNHSAEASTRGTIGRTDDGDTMTTAQNG